MKRIPAALPVAFGLVVGVCGAIWGPGLALADMAAQGAQPSVTVEAPTAEVTPYPQVLARIAVTPTGNVLDFARDDRTGRLFASGAHETVVIDATSLEEIACVPFGGELLVDGANGRLYIYPGAWSGYATGESVHVIDLTTLRVVGELPDATYADVDTENARVFTGSPWTPYADDDGSAPVRVYDAADLAVSAELTQTGIPVYNPVRGDLVVLHESATVYDLTSLRPVGELLPALVDQEIPFCNGCDYPVDGAVFGDENLLVLQLRRIATGAGPGFNPPPRFFDAETLSPLDRNDVPYQFQATCSSRPHLQGPIDGKFYRNSVYRRYIVVENLIVENTEGEQTDVRDGTYAVFVNPLTRQAIFDQGYVVDLASLTPIGRFPAFCWLDYDAQRGHFYGRDGGDLLVMAEDGGQSPVPAPAVHNVMLTGVVASIVPSPAYAQDQTVFAFVAGQGVVRSRDGGVTWSRLRGGLPETERLSLDLAISPNFAEDGTLFVGGATNTYQGEGVLRSVDGGDTWEPLWQNMAYLRVREVAVAPDFATNGEVAALSEYNRLEKWESGVAIYTSTHRGLDWTLAMTGTSSSALPTLDEVVGADNAAELPVRSATFGEGISVTVDGGKTWQLADLGQAENDYFKRIVTAPDYPADPAIYVMSRFGLWRTVDGGASWARWTDARLDGRDYTNELTAIALARGEDERSHWLFVGTAAGEIWRVQAERVKAQQPAVVPSFDLPDKPAPTNTPTPMPTPISVLPAVEATATAMPAPLSGEPPAGRYRPQGTLMNRWESDPALQQAIGWATQPNPDSVQMARQVFSSGLMLWREDTRQIYVLYSDNQWDVFDDTFVEGEAEFDPTITPPSGYQQPIRGFGKVWRAHEAVREKIGWAINKEHGFGGFVHPFERGILVTDSERTLALLEVDGERTWR